MPQSETWQVPERHARPEPQELSAQQVCPAPPQGAQRCGEPVQTLPASQARPLQQTSPGPPHEAHTPPEQVAPPAQEEPAQQGWPGIPQPWQMRSVPQTSDAPQVGVLRVQQV